MSSWTKIAGFFLAFASLLASGAAAVADDFYKGKTITFIVGFSSGGGYDTYARLLARHMPNHISGNPSIIVQNMDGAGSMRAANHVYNVAPKDGTVISAVNATLLMYQLLGGKGANTIRPSCSGSAASPIPTIRSSPGMPRASAPSRTRGSRTFPWRARARRLTPTSIRPS